MKSQWLNRLLPRCEEIAIRNSPAIFLNIALYHISFIFTTRLFKSQYALYKYFVCKNWHKFRNHVTYKLKYRIASEFELEKIFSVHCRWKIQ